MKTLQELLSREFTKYEINMNFSNFGSCDFCNDQNQTCRYHEYDQNDLYKQGLICIKCYNKIHGDPLGEDGSWDSKNFEGMIGN